MVVEYKKDLKHNYMVITEKDYDKVDEYSIKMLEAQTIEGILPVEPRRMDNKILLYYDITAKQAMTAIFDKTALTYDKVSHLCTGIIDIIERAYEYLLPEDDFILTPEYIYMEVGSNKPVLCFLPGYGRRIKEQMSSFIEYLMNKVDYSDKEAVLLVYQLYADSREEGYTFDHLIKVLQEKPLMNADIRGVRTEKESNKEKGRERYTKTDAEEFHSNHEQGEICPASAKIDYMNNLSSAGGKSNNLGNRKNCSVSISKPMSEDQENRVKSRVPVMMEKLEGEKEVPCYPLKTYLSTGVSIAGGILLIILSLRFKIIYNSFGSRIDYSKLFALLLIVLCIEGYLIKIIWCKKNRITKMVADNEYVDPRQEFIHSGVPGSGKLKKTIITDNDKGKRLTGLDYMPDYQPKDQQDIATAYQQDQNSRSLQSNLLFMNKGKIHTTSPEQGGSDNEYAAINISKAAIINRIPQGTTIKQEEEDNPTCLLNVACLETNESIPQGNAATLILKPLDELNYQPIPITEFPFFIGKLRKNVDYCLENEVVSRYHAKITKEEDIFFITDLNSMNGTFINKEAVQTYEKREIKIGDEITFANISYQFTYLS